MEANAVPEWRGSPPFPLPEPRIASRGRGTATSRQGRPPASGDPVASHRRINDLRLFKRPGSPNMSDDRSHPDEAPAAPPAPAEPLGVPTTLSPPIPPNETREDRLKRLNEKARRLPREPGVYLMKDGRGRVIYVGKSASLRDRVGSYFQVASKLEFK